MENLFLKGEWKFISEGESESVLLEVPGNWHTITGTPYASGTYGLRILLPIDVTGSTYGISFPELSQAMKVWINGKLILETGDIQEGRTDYTHFQIPLMAEPELEIMIKLRNTEFRTGGMIYPPLIGPMPSIKRHRESRIWLEAFYMGLLFIVSVYHFFLYIQKYQNRSALYLALAALFMLIRAVVTGENSIMFLMPGFSWTLDYKLEYLSVYMNGILLILFCNSTFPYEKKVIQKLIRIMTAAGILLSLITLFLPIITLSRMIYFLQTSIFLFFILGLTIMGHALLSRQKDAILLFVGGALYILFAIGDALYYTGGPEPLFNISQFGMLFFILTQSLLLARQHGDTFIKAEQLSHSLEDEVAKQTVELRASNESLKEEIKQRVKAEGLLQKLSTTDPLTGAANRLKINEHLEQCYQVYLRYGNTFGIIMFDLDHFKEVNDSFGHQIGDEVLKQVVSTTQSMIRDCDLLARWGGEEFIVLLPLMELKGTAIAAEKIRKAIEMNIFPELPRVTASFSAVVPNGKSEQLEDIFRRLDEKLYEAKHQGRNIVVS